MTFAACGGDVATTTPEPSKTYCELACDCEGCSAVEFDYCTDEFEDLSRTAAQMGCEASFRTYNACLETRTCELASLDRSGCDDKFDALSICMGSPPGCPTTGNGVCDEPEGSNTCAEGSDPDDCAAPAPCMSTNNGVCDEPEGTGTCAEGTDQADCNIMLSDCEVYCNSIQSNCIGKNAQYADKATCLATCAVIPPGMPGDTMFNSTACRSYHASAASTDPSSHCIHAGPSGGGICGDPCESFCTIVPKLCPDIYLTAKECMFECSNFPNDEPYDASDTTGDTFACRMYHATIASTQPQTHCPHVPEMSPVCL